MQRLSLLLHVAIPRNGNDIISTTPSLTQSATSNQTLAVCTGKTPVTVPDTPDYKGLTSGAYLDVHAAHNNQRMKPNCMSVESSADTGDSPHVSSDEDEEDEEDEEMADSYSPLDESDEDSDDELPMDMLSLLQSIQQSDDDLLFAENGYKKLSKICNSLQGQMFRARLTTQTATNKLLCVGDYVAIKKIDKALRKEKIAEKDDMTYCVEEDIKKEAAILQHLTVDNTPTGKVARFVEFFESESHLYLVTEYIDGMTLKEFTVQAHALIAEGKLSFAALSVAVKSIMFQLVQTIKWLHGTYHCCHLDVCSDNVMVHNIQFQETGRSGRVELRGTPKVKLIDFGVAEIFDTPRNRPTKAYSFECAKSEGLNIEESAHHAPESDKGAVYDARAMDMWSLGMILFECLVGRALYEPEDKLWDDEENGYTALKKNTLGPYLKSQGLLRCFTRESFALLEALLCMDPSKRLRAVQASKQAWFRSLFKRNFYAAKGKKKHNKWRSIEQQHMFPYYRVQV